ncbi:MAG: cobalamin biosynthesis protein [Comamonadaceae bacterium]|nr:cobalamin biosynthesis protein [Comamonadaceae bacterium]
MRAALDAALAAAGLCDADVVALATVDAKADEPALHELAAELGLPLRCHAAAELARIAVPNPSATVLKHVGTPSVSEAAALAAAGATMDALVVEKTRLRGACGRSATVSLATMNPAFLENPA